MSVLVTLFGLFIGTLGLLGMVRPDRLVRFAGAWQTLTGLYAAAALRIVLGLALFLAAPDSRAPLALRILGIVIFVAGLATPLFGLERSHRVFEWWAGRSTAFKRAWAGCAFAFGLLLVCTVAP